MQGMKRHKEDYKCLWLIGSLMNTQGLWWKQRHPDLDTQGKVNNLHQHPPRTSQDCSEAFRRRGQQLEESQGKMTAAWSSPEEG